MRIVETWYIALTQQKLIKYEKSAVESFHVDSPYPDQSENKSRLLQLSLYIGLRDDRGKRHGLITQSSHHHHQVSVVSYSTRGRPALVVVHREIITSTTMMMSPGAEGPLERRHVPWRRRQRQRSPAGDVTGGKTAQHGQTACVAAVAPCFAYDVAVNDSRTSVCRRRL